MFAVLFRPARHKINYLAGFIGSDWATIRLPTKGACTWVNIAANEGHAADALMPLAYRRKLGVGKGLGHADAHG